LARAHLIALTGICVFAFLGAIQALYGPLLPGLQRAFAIDSGSAGLIFTAHGAGALLGIFIPSVLSTGPLARHWLSIATTLVLLGAALLGASPTWAATLTGAFVLAVGFGIHVIRLNSVFISGFGARGMAMAQLLNAAFSIGCILGPLAMGLTGAATMRVFAPVSLLAAMLVPLCLLADRASSPVVPQPPVGFKDEVTPPRTDILLLSAFVLLMSLVVGVENSIAGWIATVALSRGDSYGRAADLTAAFFACIFVGRLLAAGLGHRARPNALVIGAIGLVVVFMSAAALSGAAPIAFVLTGFALAPLFAGTLAWLAEAMRGARHANAIVISGALIGSATFPPLVGRVMARFQVSAAAPAILCIAISGLIVAIWIRRMAGVKSTRI
jgi:fucose permease